MNQEKMNVVPLSYHKNGTLKSEKVCMDNSKYCYRTYYTNGNLKSEIPYFMNLKCGSEKEYYPCGNLKSETPYFMGKQMEPTKRYSKYDALIRQHFQNGPVKEIG